MRIRFPRFVVFGALGAALFFMTLAVVLMLYVNTILREDARSNLSEITNYNKNIVANRLEVEVNRLRHDAEQTGLRLQETPLGQGLNWGVIQESMNTTITGAALSSADGYITWSVGKTVNVSARRYFKAAMQGKTVLSERFSSTAVDDPIFVIAAPVRLGENVVGTLQRPYTDAQMLDLCKLRVFESRGQITLIRRDGTILASAHPELHHNETHN